MRLVDTSPHADPSRHRSAGLRLRLGFGFVALDTSLARAKDYVSDPLTQGSFPGRGSQGGTFASDGWKTTSPTDAVWYEIDEALPTASISFVVTGISPATTLTGADHDIFTIYQAPTGKPEPVEYSPYWFTFAPSAPHARTVRTSQHTRRLRREHTLASMLAKKCPVSGIGRHRVRVRTLLPACRQGGSRSMIPNQPGHALACRLAARSRFDSRYCVCEGCGALAFGECDACVDPDSEGSAGAPQGNDSSLATIR
jgi:hypothetical protein